MSEVKSKFYLLLMLPAGFFKLKTDISFHFYNISSTSSIDLANLTINKYFEPKQAISQKINFHPSLFSQMHRGHERQSNYDIYNTGID